MGCFGEEGRRRHQQAKLMQCGRRRVVVVEEREAAGWMTDGKDRRILQHSAPRWLWRPLRLPAQSGAGLDSNGQLLRIQPFFWC